MSNKKALGFVNLEASEVVTRAEARLKFIAEDRERRRKEWIMQFVGQPVGWWGRMRGRKPLTEEQAIAMVKEDMWLCDEYYYMTPKFDSRLQQDMRKLINVGKALQTDGLETTMAISIETADSLF